MGHPRLVVSPGSHGSFVSLRMIGLFELYAGLSCTSDSSWPSLRPSSLTAFVSGPAPVLASAFVGGGAVDGGDFLFIEAQVDCELAAVMGHVVQDSVANGLVARLLAHKFAG